MLVKHRPTCLTHLGHSFVSETYKASLGMAFERTTLPSPLNLTWELKKQLSTENKDSHLFFPSWGECSLIPVYLQHIYPLSIYIFVFLFHFQYLWVYLNLLLFSFHNNG